MHSDTKHSDAGDAAAAGVFPALTKPDLSAWDFVKGIAEWKRKQTGFFMMLVGHRQKHRQLSGRMFRT